MNLTLLKSLWTLFRDGKNLSPIIPSLKAAVNRCGGTEIMFVVEALADSRDTLAGLVASNLNLKNRVGLRLLDLAPEQQELVAKMKEGKKLVCLDDLQQQP